MSTSVMTRLQRALERWQPEYLNWWNDLGPDKGKELEVYLRTAISVEKEGWAHFDFVRMPEYRWGIFLAPAEENRKIGFGQHLVKMHGRKCRENTVEN